MKRETIAIIGGGLAGLSAGAYAQMNGFQCRIFEHGQRPGGVCTAWRRGGYTFDGCIQWLLGIQPTSSLYRMYRELGIIRDVKILPVDVLQHILDERTSASFTIDRHIDRMADELLALAPSDRRLVGQIARAARRVSHDRGYGLEEAPGLRGLLAQLRMMAGFMPVLLNFPGSHERLLRRVRTPQLHRLLEHFTDPDMPAFLLPVLMGWTAAGVGRVEGGSDRVPEAVVRRYRELGGEIQYGSTVTRIVVERDRAVGIQLASGEVFRADHVISAADGRSTIFELLGGRYTNARIRQRYETWRLFTPIVLIHYGAAMTTPSGFDATQILLDPPLQACGRSHSWLVARTLDYDPGLAPAGHSVVQATLEASWDFWSELAKDAKAYADAKADLAEAVLRRLEPHVPGLRAAVEVTDVATPVTYHNLTRNHRGAYEGWLPTSRTIFARLEKQLPGLERFTMAGQWTEPGGGVPTVLNSGRKAIKLICQQAGRPFHREDPKAVPARPPAQPEATALHPPA